MPVLLKFYAGMTGARDGAVLVLIAALLFVLTLNVYWRNREALTVSAATYAFACAGIIEILCGTFILITGQRPSKFYGAVAVPRSSGITDLSFAAGWLVIAFGLQSWKSRR